MSLKTVERIILAWYTGLVILAVTLWIITGCANRPQTCAPKDTRCQVLLFISTVDMESNKAKETNK